jgi:hypothetical protein
MTCCLSPLRNELKQEEDSCSAFFSPLTPRAHDAPPQLKMPHQWMATKIKTTCGRARSVHSCIQKKQGACSDTTRPVAACCSMRDRNQVSDYFHYTCLSSIPADIIIMICPYSFALISASHRNKIGLISKFISRLCNNTMVRVYFQYCCSGLVDKFVRRIDSFRYHVIETDVHRGVYFQPFWFEIITNCQ